MRTQEEITYDGTVKILPDTTMFNKSALTWLYWDGVENTWTWANMKIDIEKDEKRLDKCTVYYFMCEEGNKMWFVCAYNIRTNLWVKPVYIGAFNTLTKHEIYTPSVHIFPGETIYYFVYDTRMPYIRKVTYPNETFGEKAFRFFSWMNPFRK